MRNLWLITKREFFMRLKSGAFITSTILLVLVLFGATVLPSIMDKSSKSKPMDVRVLDQTGQIFAPLEQAMALMPDQSKKRAVKLSQVTGDEAALTDGARKGEYTLLVVEGSFPSDVRVRFLAAQLSSLTDSRVVLGPLEGMVRSARMQARGLSPEVALEIMQPMKVEELQLAAKDGERNQAQFLGTLFLAMGAVMAVYMVSVMNSQLIFQGVLEEKVSRVVEVMAAAVKPSEMMAGKVIGLGALGLLQTGLMLLAWMGGNSFASRSGTEIETQSLSLGVGLLIVAFVLLSYLLNATLMAALGATISRMEDSQTVMTPVLMLMMVPMFLLTPVMNDPNSSTAVILSFIPIFTPVVMLMRVMLGDVPSWQVWLSVAGLVLTTGLVTWLSGRVYRAALLTFGTRPSMKQLWLYLRAG